MERRIILEHLIKKFESSSHFLHPGQSRRRVMLRVDNNELPEYNVESAATRDAYNMAAKELKKNGLIDLQWASDRPIITHFYLNLNNVDSAYNALGRIHPAKRAKQFISILREQIAPIHSLWIQNWACDLCQSISETYRIPPVYLKNVGLMEDLLRAFRQYDDLNGKSTSLRAFSIQCYHDSKRFERDVQSEFLRIARQYNRELADLCTDEDFREREQLAFLGLIVRPELFELSGRFTLDTDKGRVDFAPLFPYGVALPSTQIDHLKQFLTPAITIITFIENKTNYDTYIQQELKDNEMAVYLGGFLSPAQRKLCQAIATDVNADTVVRLWSDIDLGGFRMFEQLHQVFPAIIPFRMSTEDILKYRENGLARSSTYLDILRRALQENRFPLFNDAIRTVLEYGVTIEQEVFYL